MSRVLSLTLTLIITLTRTPASDRSRALCRRAVPERAASRDHQRGQHGHPRREREFCCHLSVHVCVFCVSKSMLCAWSLLISLWPGVLISMHHRFPPFFPVCLWHFRSARFLPHSSPLFLLQVFLCTVPPLLPNSNPDPGCSSAIGQARRPIMCGRAALLAGRP